MESGPQNDKSGVIASSFYHNTNPSDSFVRDFSLHNIRGQ
jgi:hypothetical protein